MGKKKEKREPPDLKQCQVLIKGGSFVTIGPRPIDRCQNKAAYVIREVKPGPDGLRGSMSVCESCAEKFKRRTDVPKVTWKKIVCKTFVKEVKKLCLEEI